MDRDCIPSGFARLTKKQKMRIGQLGAEWTVLDSEEHLVGRLIGEQYGTLRPGTKRPPELVELEREQGMISARKREISAEFIAVEQGGSHPKRRSTGRRPDVYVEVRDRWIRRLRDHSDKEICRTLDLELAQSGRPPMGLPDSWTKNYGVGSYLAAYKNPNCKALVQKLISVAKKTY